MILLILYPDVTLTLSRGRSGFYIVIRYSWEAEKLFYGRWIFKTVLWQFVNYQGLLKTASKSKSTKTAKSCFHFSQLTGRHFEHLFFRFLPSFTIHRCFGVLFSVPFAQTLVNLSFNTVINTREGATLKTHLAFYFIKSLRAKITVIGGRYYDTRMMLWWYNWHDLFRLSESVNPKSLSKQF